MYGAGVAALSADGVVPLSGVFARNDQWQQRRDWDRALERMTHAFQPVVNVHSGVCFGYEALLRGWENAGFASIADVFDEAFRDGVLYAVELALRDKAIARFARITGCESRKLFYNLDNRFIELPDFQPGGTARVLENHGVPSTALILEVSERHDVDGGRNLERIFAVYRKQGYRLALDDYGVGFSQLRMLYYCEPDIIKMDRFFISGIQHDRKKEMLVGQLVSMAHLMGSTVVAEGVETEDEYFVCKRLGCDLIQGFLVQHPSEDLAALLPRYPEIELLSSRERRHTGSDSALVSARLKTVEPLNVTASLTEAFGYFREHQDTPFVPVVDNAGQPCGLIRESDFKAFAYSLYGRELLRNPSVDHRLQRFIRRCPTVSLWDSVERILEAFSASENRDGLIVVDSMRYVGLLDGLALLEMLNEKNTVAARDQNPLTQMPGNNAIYRHASQAMGCGDRPFVFFYFDFDNFKPFNDIFGFRQGDRAILLFADILRKTLIGRNWFLGHVGGDDFFAAAHGISRDEALDLVRKVTARFCSEITAFYDPESRARGHLEGVDRNGTKRSFPLMTVSIAMLELPPWSISLSFDDVAPVISALKNNAKASGDHLCQASLVGPGCG